MLGKMLRAGTITQEMHDAAKDFQANSIIANLDPLRAVPILRVPGNGREPDLNERQLDPQPLSSTRSGRRWARALSAGSSLRTHRSS